ADRPRALLHVAVDPPRLLFSGADPSPATGTEGSAFARFLETQCALVKSRIVLEPALRDRSGNTSIAELAAIKSRTDPIAWLEQNLEVTNLKNTELIQIAIRPGSDARMGDQAAIINAVVESYLNNVVNQDQNKRRERWEMLKKLSEK